VPITEVSGLLIVNTEDLPAAALPSGGSSDNTQYDCFPTDGTLRAAPDSGSEDTVEFAFTMASFTIVVVDAPVMIRISADGVAYGNWVYVPEGLVSFNIEAVKVQVREAVNGGGATYQLTGFA
jgi:hypothetical protein